MSSLHLAISLLALLAAALLWRAFARPRGVPPTTVESAPPIHLLSAGEVATIEAALGVSLPMDYARFLQTGRPDAIDETSVRDDPELIIGFTRDYRDDCQWPPHLVWIGDEGDGCPRVLDCVSGEVYRLQKGNLAKAWDRHASFAAFVAERLQKPG